MQLNNLLIDHLTDLGFPTQNWEIIALNTSNFTGRTFSYYKITFKFCHLATLIIYRDGEVCLRSKLFHAQRFFIEDPESLDILSIKLKELYLWLGKHINADHWRVGQYEC